MAVPADSSASKPLRIAVAAGEASGDSLGAGLIEAIRAREPDAEFFGIAGPRMIAADCEPWYRTEELSVMGLAEVLKDLPRLLRLRRAFIDRLRDAPPDIFIGIDSPDFNLPVEAALKKLAIPTVQYVSPQVWAWRQSRVKGIRKAADLVLCLLPFETKFYTEHGVDSVFVGHPLADEIPLVVDVDAAKRALGLTESKRILALLPGSRNSEVLKLARPFLETGSWLRKRHPGLEIVVALANETTRVTFEEATRGVSIDPSPRVVVGRTRDVLMTADVVLTASGTASLEAALLKRPMVVAYIISRLTHRLLKLLGINKLDNFSLPNLLAGQEVVPEFLQTDVCPAVLGPALEEFLDQSPGEKPWLEAFERIHRQLRRDASDGAAIAVLDLLGREAGRQK